MDICYPEITSRSPYFSDLTHDQMLLNLYVLFHWCIYQMLLYLGGAMQKSEATYVGRAFSLAEYVC